MASVGAFRAGNGALASSRGSKLLLVATGGGGGGRRSRRGLVMLVCAAFMAAFLASRWLLLLGSSHGSLLGGDAASEARLRVVAAAASKPHAHDQQQQQQEGMQQQQQQQQQAAAGNDAGGRMSVRMRHQRTRRKQQPQQQAQQQQQQQLLLSGSASEAAAAQVLQQLGNLQPTLQPTAAGVQPQTSMQGAAAAAADGGQQLLLMPAAGASLSVVLGANDNTSSYIAARGVAPTRLRFPLWWHGPMWAGSGYASEAINYVLSLLRTGRLAPADIWAYHHGDNWREHVVNSLSDADRTELEYLQSLPAKYRHARAAIVVCHSLPTNWAFPEPMWTAGAPCPPNPREFGWVYQVGRTMFETERLPAMFVPRLNAMNEIWVPSAWQRDTFAASGVDPDKLVVVPEGVNTTLFDPAAHTPLPLADKAQLVFGLPWEQKRARANASGGASKPFVFVSTFKWEARKGWDILLQAYLSAFTADDDVELYILTKPFGGSGSSFKEKMRGWADSRYGSAAAISSQQRIAAEAAAGGSGGGASSSSQPAGTAEGAEQQVQQVRWQRAGDSGAAAAGSAAAAGAVGAGAASGRHLKGSSGDEQLSQQQQAQEQQAQEQQMHAHAADVAQQIRDFAHSLRQQQQQQLLQVQLRRSRSLLDNGSTSAGGNGTTASADAAAAAASGVAASARMAAAAAAEAGRYPTLYVVDAHISDADFPRFYKAGDAFVLPSRGEGWGRPHVEAMAMGLPVISTNWSGITAYLDKSVGYPIAVEKLVPVSGGAEVAWWFKGLRWAQPSAAHLGCLMQHVLANRTEAAARGAAARARMVAHYSPEAIADVLVAQLRRIEAAIP